MSFSILIASKWTAIISLISLFILFISSRFIINWLFIFSLLLLLLFKSFFFFLQLSLFIQFSVLHLTLFYFCLLLLYCTYKSLHFIVYIQSTFRNKSLNLGPHQFKCVSPPFQDTPLVFLDCMSCFWPFVFNGVQLTIK